MYRTHFQRYNAEWQVHVVLCFQLPSVEALVAESVTLIALVVDGQLPLHNSYVGTM